MMTEWAAGMIEGVLATVTAGAFWFYWPRPVRRTDRTEDARQLARLRRRKMRARQ